MKTLRLVAVIAAAGLMMAGCANGTPDTDAPVSAPHTAETEAVEPATQDRSPRGALPKELGQPAGLVNNDGTTLAEFVVHEISATADCNPYSDEPVNGQFRTLRMTAATGNDPDGLLPIVSFGFGWEYVGPTGRSVEASTVEAAGCALDVPQQLGPNRNYEFDVIVDIPQDAAGGVLVFSSPAVAEGGWEWQVTDSTA
ncbi:hypothetical protein [Pseudonocardia sp. NPDC046786]|uniref:hypothetical protein n=1 Tax=Pseudonocardia sp. NPDC046786 TaxID=3155471 RepID=UPI003407DD21